MNAPDILHYGHLHLIDALSGMNEVVCSVIGVTRKWSTKDVIAHITGSELVLAELLELQIDSNAVTPNLKSTQLNHDRYVESVVEDRKEKTWDEVMNEYKAAHDRVMKAIEHIPSEHLRTRATIPWYGEQYSLEDYIVYTNYGHKEEHTAQIKMFRRIQGY